MLTGTARACTSSHLCSSRSARACNRAVPTCSAMRTRAADVEQERARSVLAAEHLRAAGLRCEVVSVGSTPTALSAQQLDGVTEVRAGVYVFFDLVMAGTTVCGLDEIALSVLTTVIGHQPERGWIMIDAGWCPITVVS